MRNPILHILDVFAEEKFAGNQLAVVRRCEALSEARMQKIAAEMNFSETAFVVSEEYREGDGGYDARIFTPREEVPFAGHPALGTAQVLREEALGRSAGEVVLNLKAGQVPVTIGGEDGEVLWMEQPPPAFGATFDPGWVARVLGLGEGEVDDGSPVQEVSTGLPAILVPLRSLDSLRRCRVRVEEYLELTRASEAKAIYAFCREPRERDNDLSARFFADYYGVPEDPATGSAAGCLAAYLVQDGRPGGAMAARLEQGHEIGRPSLLYLRANRLADPEGGIRVSVGGKVVAVARGELL